MRPPAPGITRPGAMHSARHCAALVAALLDIMPLEGRILALFKNLRVHRSPALWDALIPVTIHDEIRLQSQGR